MSSKLADIVQEAQNSKLDEKSKDLRCLVVQP